jgi:hypothetical protein
MKASSRGATHATRNPHRYLQILLSGSVVSPLEPGAAPAVFRGEWPHWQRKGYILLMVGRWRPYISAQPMFPAMRLPQPSRPSLLAPAVRWRRCPPSPEGIAVAASGDRPGPVDGSAPAIAARQWGSAHPSYRWVGGLPRRCWDHGFAADAQGDRGGDSPPPRTAVGSWPTIPTASPCRLRGNCGSRIVARVARCGARQPMGCSPARGSPWGISRHGNQRPLPLSWNLPPLRGSRPPGDLEL